MRRSLLILLVIALICALTAPVANADMETRVKKLEDEIKSIKQSSKEMMAKLEESIFESLPATLQKQSSRLYDTLAHHGGETANHVQKEYPKYIKMAQAVAADLPKHTKVATEFVQKNSAHYFQIVNKELSAVLTKQGVPKEYVPMVVLGTVSFALLIVAIITLFIVKKVLGAIFSILCCRKSSKKTQQQQNKKQTKKQQ